MAAEHLKCEWPGLRGVVNVTCTLDYNDFVKKVKYLNNFYMIIC